MELFKVCVGGKLYAIYISYLFFLLYLKKLNQAINLSLKVVRKSLTGQLLGHGSMTVCFLTHRVSSRWWVSIFMCHFLSISGPKITFAHHLNQYINIIFVTWHQLAIVSKIWSSKRGRLHLGDLLFAVLSAHISWHAKHSFIAKLFICPD